MIDVRTIPSGERGGWILCALLALPVIAWTAAVIAAAHWLLVWLEDRHAR